jgi:hypothetical protein
LPQLRTHRGSITTALLFFVLCLSLSAVLVRLVFPSSNLFGAEHKLVAIGTDVNPYDLQSQREAVLETKLRTLLRPIITPDDMRLLVHYAGVSAAPDSAIGNNQHAVKVVILLNRESIDPELQRLIRQLLLPALGLNAANVTEQEELATLQLVARPFLDNANQVWYASFSDLDIVLVGLAIFLSGLFGLMFWQSAYRGSFDRSPLAYGAIAHGVTGRKPLRHGESASEGLQALSQHEPRRIANVLSQWMEQDES